MKTLNNKGASAVKSYLVFILLGIVAVGIVWAQVRTPSQVDVEGTQLMLGRGPYAKPYTIRGVVWSPTAASQTPGSAGPSYGIQTGSAMQYVSVPDDARWNLSGSFTMAVWVKMNSYSPAWWEGAFMAHDEGGGGLPKWIFTYDQGSSSLLWHLNGRLGNATLTASAPLDTGKWYLVGISRDASNTYKFWVNGAQVGAAQRDATQIEDANSPLTIGFGEGGSTLNGYLAEPLIFSRELSSADWTALFNGGTGAKGDINQSPWKTDPTTGLGLIGGWHFDEGTGTTAADFSGAGFDGALVNSPAWGIGAGPGGTVAGFGASLVNSPAWVTGQVGGTGPAYSIQTTTATQYASVPDDPKWDFSGAFSLAMWVNMSSYSPAWWEGAFMAHDEGGGGLPKWIFTYDQGSGSLIWHINGYGGGTTLTQANPLSLNTWYLVGISRDASNTYKFWVNGAQVGAAQTDATQIPDANSPLTIGFGEGGSTLDGYLAEPLIFNRELQAANWTALFNGGIGVKGDKDLAPWNDGLIGGWHFDEGTGTVAAEFSGSGATGGGTTEVILLDPTPQINLIRDLRANTVRITDPALVTTALLDQLYNNGNNGIMAIVTVANSREEIETQAYRDVVNAHKDNQAILMWNIGEEWDKDGGGYMGYGDIDSAAQAISNAATDIRSIDGNHPVTTTLAEQSSLPLIGGPLFNIGIAGFNVYTTPGGSGVADIINFSSSFPYWPIYLSGLDLDPAAPQDPATRRLVIEESWSQLKPNLSARYPGRLYLGVTVRLSDLVDDQLNRNEAYTALQQVYANLERPEIVSLEPAIVVPESELLIRGSEFGDEYAPGIVDLDGFMADIVSWSDTAVRIMVPREVLYVAPHRMALFNSNRGLISDPYEFTVGSMHIDSIDTQGSVQVGQSIEILSSNLGAYDPNFCKVRFTKGEVSVDVVPLEWDPIGGRVVFSVPEGLHGGANEIRLVYAGSISDNFETVAVKPHIRSIDPAARVGDTVTITGSSFGDSGVVIDLNLGAVSGNPAPTSVSESSITFTVPAGAYGAGLPVRVVNDVGTSSEDPVQTFTVKPTADLILTSSGDYVGVEAVVSGNGFGPSGQVWFGPYIVTGYTARSDTEIAFIIPDGLASGPNTLVVVQSEGNVADPITLIIKPHITSITPASGLAEASIVISATSLGSNLPSVTIGGTDVTDEAWVLGQEGSQFSCTIPNGLAAGDNNVIVTANGQESAASTFTVYLQPVITSALNTATGLASGAVGDSVTIIGTGLGVYDSRASRVNFTNNTTGDVATVDPTGVNWNNPVGTITLTLPSDAIGGANTVTVAGAGNIISAGKPFTVINPPTITSINPTSGAAGSELVITGTGLGQSATVTFSTWEDGLIGGWHFNEGSGTTAADFSGGGFNGTLVNSPTWVFPATGPGYGIKTTPGLKYVEIQDNPKWDFTGPFTLAIWANRSGPVTWYQGSFFGHDDSDSNSKWLFGYDSTNQRLNWHINPGNVVLYGPCSLSQDTWYLVGVSRDASNKYRFWVNGAQVGSTQTNTTAIPNVAKTLKIGYGEGGLSFPGYLAEPLIFDRELSASDWQTIGGVSGLNFSNRSSTNITCEIPAGLIAGPHSLVATSGGGLSAPYRSITILPSLATVYKTGTTTSSAQIGDSVTLSGNFGRYDSAVSRVKFTNNSSGNVATLDPGASWGSTSITLNPLPASVEPGDNTVTVTAAGNFTTAGAPFTVLPPPTITAIDPTSAAPGAALTITGVSLGESATVAFDGTKGNMNKLPWSSGLIGGWHFDEGTGTTVADFSGYGINGTLPGSLAWGTQPTTGPGYGIRFTGATGNYVSIPDADKWDFNSTGPFTMAIWVNMSGWPANWFGAAFMAHDNGSEPKWIFGYDNGSQKLKWHIRTSSQLQFELNQAWTPTLNTWYLVGISRSTPSAYKFWVNGTLLGTVVPPAALPTDNVLNTPLTIGYGEGGSSTFNGYLAEPLIFNKELSASDWQTLYNYGGGVSGLNFSNRSSTNITCEIPAGLGVGPHNLVATFDGKLSAPYRSITILPSLATVYKTGTTTSSAAIGDSVTLSGNFGCYDSAVSRVKFTNNSSGNVATLDPGASWGSTSITLNPLPASVEPGANTVTVTAVGNVTTGGNPFTVEMGMTGITPAQIQRGDTLTISGRGFGAVTTSDWGNSAYANCKIDFGSRVVTKDQTNIPVWTDTQIQFKAPIDADFGGYLVYVTNALSNRTAVPRSVTVFAPVVSSVAAGHPGTSVSISGIGFGTRPAAGDPTYNNYKVMFGTAEVSGSSISSWTSGSIACTIPGLPAGIYPVQVINPVLGSSNIYPSTVYGPIITTNYWRYGRVQVGDPHTLNTTTTDTNFQFGGLGQVRFEGGADATNLSWGPKDIGFRVPSVGVGTYNVRICHDGQGVCSNPFRLTVIPTSEDRQDSLIGSRVISMTPTTATPGTTITVTGANFDGSTSIRLGGATAGAIPATYIDSTHVSFVVPSGIVPGQYAIYSETDRGVCSSSSTPGYLTVN